MHKTTHIFNNAVYRNEANTRICTKWLLQNQTVPKALKPQIPPSSVSPFLSAQSHCYFRFIILPPPSPSPWPPSPSLSPRSALWSPPPEAASTGHLSSSWQNPSPGSLYMAHPAPPQGQSCASGKFSSHCVDYTPVPHAQCLATQ